MTPKIQIDLTRKNLYSYTWRQEFKRAAKVAKWTPAEIERVGNQLLKCDTVEEMVETLKPYAI